MAASTNRALDGRDSDPSDAINRPSSFTSIQACVDRQIAQTPWAVAVTCNERDYSYADLDAAANAASCIVGPLLVGSEPLVALCAEPSFSTIAWILGILRAGAAYLPLDAALPDLRIAQIMEEAVPCLLVLPKARNAAALLVGRQCPRVIYFETAEPPEPADIIQARITDTASLAYVIYTSGSTGQPKGVEITHGAVLNLIDACLAQPGLAPGETSFAMARIGFDVSVLETFMPLACGARIVIIPSESVRDPRRLVKMIEQYDPHVIQATPALWRGLVEAGWHGSRRLRIWSGAEALPLALAHALLLRGASVWNAYGPTEATVLATVCQVDGTGKDVPLGRAIPEASVVIRDPDLRPAPRGERGEICIAGKGLARGYRGRPDLTDQRFVYVPGETGTVRCYRSGDIGSIGDDGQLHFHGRMDDQVQLRGFRVEPAEVEATLAEHPAVVSCVVQVSTDALGHNALIAHVVLRTGEETPPSAMMAFLRTRLPHYMVPHRIIACSALPLTDNGKIDRLALAGPLIVAVDPPNTAFTATEQCLHDIWQELLGPAEIDNASDFFDLGGYSLLTIKLLLRIEEQFDRDLSLSELLSASTLTGMAAIIDAENDAAKSRRVVPLGEVPDGTSSPPLYWLDVGPLLREALSVAGARVPLYGFNLTPGDEKALLGREIDIPRLATEMIRMLDDETGGKEYQLGGWCRWGIVAYEMACQLQKQGRHVPMLILLDAERLGWRGCWRARISALFRIIRGRRVTGKLDAASSESVSIALSRLSARYVPRAYRGAVTLVAPHRTRMTLSAGWRRVVRGRLRFHGVAGDHLSMVAPPHAWELGNAILAASIGEPVRSL